jgi:RNAse (barnase) inhibitor barstar
MTEDVAGGADGSRYVYEAPLTAEAILAVGTLARSLGFEFVRVDLSGCSDKAEFLQRIATALAFPSWFGHNWDALFDCLSDLGWRPAPGYVLLLENPGEFRDAEPQVFDTALAILGDAAVVWQERGVQFRVFVAAGL